jgi:hypothetical protein
MERRGSGFVRIPFALALRLTGENRNPKKIKYFSKSKNWSKTASFIQSSFSTPFYSGRFNEAPRKSPHWYCSNTT